MARDRHEQDLAWHIFEYTGSPYAFLLYRDAELTAAQAPAYKLPPFREAGEMGLPGVKDTSRDKLKLI